MSAPLGPVARECVEGYLYSSPPLRVLVFRRPPVRGGFWVPISGKVERGDAGLEAALGRELSEETGLPPTTPVESLDWHVPFRVDNGETWRLHAYAVRVAPGFQPRLSDEHDAFAWVTPTEAIERLHFPDNAEAVRRLVRRQGPVAPNV